VPLSDVIDIFFLNERVNFQDLLAKKKIWTAVTPSCTTSEGEKKNLKDRELNYKTRVVKRERQ